jgi:hypothetical protein
MKRAFLVCASMIGDERILRQFVSSARTKESVILVILWLATNERKAEALVKNDYWFDSPLPTNADTLKLFFVILGHAQIQPLAMGSRRRVSLFTLAILDVGFVNVSLFAGFMKRLWLTKRFVDDLGRAGFFAAFVRAKAKCNEEVVISALFNAFRTIAGWHLSKRCSKFANSPNSK